MKLKLAFLGLFLAAFLAHADTNSSMGNMDMSGMNMSSSSANSPYMTSMNAGMATMNHDMANAPMNGNPDHDFVAMMIPHHQGAIDMAKVELQYGKDPAMRKLAKEIIAAQKEEIAHMDAWLKTDAAKAPAAK